MRLRYVCDKPHDGYFNFANPVYHILPHFQYSHNVGRNLLCCENVSDLLWLSASSCQIPKTGWLRFCKGEQSCEETTARSMGQSFTFISPLLSSFLHIPQKKYQRQWLVMSGFVGEYEGPPFGVPHHSPSYSSYLPIPVG